MADEHVLDSNASEVEYIPTNELKPFDEEGAISSFQSLKQRLDSKNWLEACVALNDLRRIAQFHGDLLLHDLSEYCYLVLKSLKNPRSALCKTSLMALADAFSFLQDSMLQHVDALLLQLLMKASHDKKFVCEEAESALHAMAVSLSPIPTLQKLQMYVAHRNPRVRAKAAVFIHQCAERLDIEGLKSFGLDVLLKIVAVELSDQLPEARDAARKLSFILCRACDNGGLDQEEDTAPSTEKENETSESSTKWEEFCRKRLSSSDASAVLRITAGAAA
eukprot:TRINITY_DN14873_c1_g1_i1.p1 TRINITY_DN14873_c1_g1~~TRINITY_DN14873_c1_g1_i1.p1  ORF type:complete len:277 (-),score=52.84 TRINITY_DN14873_c1_g1_i1:351-1181(-)